MVGGGIGGREGPGMHLEFQRSLQPEKLCADTKTELPVEDSWGSCQKLCHKSTTECKEVVLGCSWSGHQLQEDLDEEGRRAKTNQSPQHLSVCYLLI